MVNLTRSTVWVDVNGSTRQTILRGNATLSPVTTQLLALSNAAGFDCWEGPPSGPFGSATAATYQTVGDYAELVYTDAGGSLVYITLPAPVASIFMADGETVDATAIASLTAAVVGLVLTGSGAAVSAFVGGVRRAKLREYQ